MADPFTAQPQEQDWLGSNWGNIALPLAVATLTALRPRTAPAVHAGLGALTLAQQAREIGRRRQQEEQFRQSLPGILNREIGTGTFRDVPTGNVIPQIETEPADQPMGNRLETTQQENMRPLYKPIEKSTIAALAQGGQLGPAAHLLAQIGGREPKEHIFGGETGGYNLYREGQGVTPLQPGIGRAPERPISVGPSHSLIRPGETTPLYTAPAAEPKERNMNTVDLATFVGTGGKVKGASIPEDMTLDQGKAALKEARALQQQNININQAGLDIRRQNQGRVPDQDRRTISNLDTSVQQLDRIETAFKQTPAFKTGQASDALKAALSTNTKARFLDELGVLPTEGLTAEEKKFAAEYNTMLLKLRALSGDNRFSDQDAARAMSALGSAYLGGDFPLQLQATKRFLASEKQNLLGGLEGQGYNVQPFSSSGSPGTPVAAPSGKKETAAEVSRRVLGR